MQKVLVDILHPAHLHFFKRTLDELKRRDIEVILCTREKEMTVTLARELNFDQRVLSIKGTSTGSLVSEGINRLLELRKIIKQEKPALLLGVMGIFIAPLSQMEAIPSLVFYDTETAWLTNWIAFRLASRVLVPTCFEGHVFSNTVRYPSYQTFSSLYEKAKLIAESGFPKRELILFRFVSRSSSHEYFERNQSWSQRSHWVNAVKGFPIEISSEELVPENLASFLPKEKVSEFHLRIHQSQLVISESPTVCSEAACLGVPSYYMSDSPRGYIHELEQSYQLVRTVLPRDQDEFIEKLKSGSWRDDFNGLESNFKRLLKDKIDPTPFILSQIDELLKKR